MCEDSKIGISLIFTVQNGIEYMRERQAGFPADPTTSVTLSGLALSRNDIASGKQRREKA